jgi:indolepyruvate ferredoxin oxidoreductase alpha subunit
VISADDPGMASSQNEQDNRRYAVAAGVPMLEPSDSQEAYDFTHAAIEISERWHVPVLLRLTTRVCHAKTVVGKRRQTKPPAPPAFQHDIKARVMVPSNARPAHRRLREKLAQMAQWNETNPQNRVVAGSKELGIIASGISFVHAREAVPNASILKLGMTYPLPVEMMRKFAASVKRCVVIEEGDPYLVEAAGAAGIRVEGKADMYRFNELDVARVRRILAGDTTPEAAPPKGKPPSLCQACPHRVVFEAFKNLDCIVAGDIGCYTLGALPPYEAMDTCVCMGAALGVGLGLRHVLPPDQAKRVVSVIGDSTFVHSGLTGLVEMVYNPPPSGHVVVIVDNGTTAMTGLQEHPGTGRTLKHEPTKRFSFEGFARALGIENVQVILPTEQGAFAKALTAALDSGELAVLITRQPCLLAAPKIREYEKANAVKCEAK